MNPFDLLGDDDAEDPSQLIAAKHVAAAAPKKGPDHGQGKQPAAAPQQNKPANLPSKPLPPAQAGEFLCFSSRKLPPGGVIGCMNIWI